MKWYLSIYTYIAKMRSPTLSLLLSLSLNYLVAKRRRRSPHIFILQFISFMVPQCTWRVYITFHRLLLHQCWNNINTHKHIKQNCNYQFVLFCDEIYTMQCKLSTIIMENSWLILSTLISFSCTVCIHCFTCRYAKVIIHENLNIL